mgnify:CR=1 FL=1
MTEEERKTKLDWARRKAVDYATAVESPVKLRSMAITDDAAIDRANMWARVADALKAENTPEPDPHTTREWITQ